jgi:predicted Zn-dependent protease
MRAIHVLGVMMLISSVLISTLALAQDTDFDTAPAPLAPSLPRLGSPENQVLSASEEARIGREMLREVRRALDWVDDPAINAYVRDLGARIAAATSMPAARYQFFVIDDPRINAFAMPGGFIGIHRPICAPRPWCWRAY